MTLPFPPPSGYKFLENTHKSYRTNTRAFLVNYTPSSKLNCTPGYFLEKLHFSATSSLCQLQEKVGCAHQKSSPHTHTFPPPSTPDLPALQTQALRPCCLPPALPSKRFHSRGSRPLPPGLRPPGPHPGPRRLPREVGTPSLSSPGGTAVTHRAHLQGAPAPAFPGRGWPGPQRGGQGPRFSPRRGGGPGAKSRPAGLRPGCDGTLTWERDANSILPTRAPAFS